MYGIDFDAEQGQNYSEAGEEEEEDRNNGALWSFQRPRDTRM